MVPGCVLLSCEGLGFEMAWYIKWRRDIDLVPTKIPKASQYSARRLDRLVVDFADKACLNSVVSNKEQFVTLARCDSFRLTS